MNANTIKLPSIQNLLNSIDYSNTANNNNNNNNNNINNQYSNETQVALLNNSITDNNNNNIQNHQFSGFRRFNYNSMTHTTNTSNNGNRKFRISSPYIPTSPPLSNTPSLTATNPLYHNNNNSNNNTSSTGSTSSDNATISESSSVSNSGILGMGGKNNNNNNNNNNIGVSNTPAPMPNLIIKRNINNNTVIEKAPGSKSNNERKHSRYNLPKETVEILNAWLLNHLNNPYPTSQEKKELLIKTGLTKIQLSNWFINQRRRKIFSNYYDLAKNVKEANDNPKTIENGNVNSTSSTATVTVNTVNTNNNDITNNNASNKSDKPTKIKATLTRRKKLIDRLDELKKLTSTEI